MTTKFRVRAVMTTSIRFHKAILLYQLYARLSTAAAIFAAQKECDEARAEFERATQLQPLQTTQLPSLQITDLQPLQFASTYDILNITQIYADMRPNAGAYFIFAK